VPLLCLPPPGPVLCLDVPADLHSFLAWWFALSDDPRQLAVLYLDEAGRLLAVIDFDDLDDFAPAEYADDAGWLVDRPEVPFFAAAAIEPAELLVASCRDTADPGAEAAEVLAFEELRRHGMELGWPVRDWIVVEGGRCHSLG
jgi:hypothetical protein